MTQPMATLYPVNNIYQLIHIPPRSHRATSGEVGFIDEDEVRQLSQLIGELHADSLLVRNQKAQSGQDHKAEDDFHRVVISPLKADFEQWVREHGGLLDRIFRPDTDFEALRSRYNDARTAWTVKFNRTLPGAPVPAGGPTPPAKPKSGLGGPMTIIVALAIGYAALKSAKFLK